MFIPTRERAVKPLFCSIGIGGAILGSAAIGAASGLFGSSKAAGSAKDISKAQIEEQRRQYNLNRADQMPYMEAGYNALADLEGYTPFEYNIEADPGYQFALEEGQRAGARGAAARGHGNSGNVLAALTDRATGLASTYSNDAFNRQIGQYGTNLNRTQSLAGMGQSATNQVGQAGSMSANAISNAYGGRGAGEQNAYYSGANAINNAAQSGIGNWLQYDYLNSGPGRSSAINSWRSRV